MSEERGRPYTAMMDEESYILRRARQLREETAHLIERARRIGHEIETIDGGSRAGAEPDERAVRAGCSPVAAILLRWASEAAAAGVTEHEFLEGLQEELELLQMVLEGLETVREELPAGLWPW